MPTHKKYCTNHPDKKATSICRYCRKPFCSDCLHFAMSGSFGSESFGGYCSGNRCQNIFRKEMEEVYVDELLHYGVSKESVRNGLKTTRLDEGTISGIMESIELSVKLRPKVYSAQQKLAGGDSSDKIIGDLVSGGESQEAGENILAAARARNADQKLKEKIQVQFDKEDVSCQSIVKELMNEGMQNEAAVDVVLRIADGKIAQLAGNQNSVISFIFLGILGGIGAFAIGMSHEKLAFLTLVGLVGIGFGIMNIVGTVRLSRRIRELKQSVLAIAPADAE